MSTFYTPKQANDENTPGANQRTPSRVASAIAALAASGKRTGPMVPRHTPVSAGVVYEETLKPLPTSPRAADQYAITDWEDSDLEGEEDEFEDAQARRRAAKHIPAWCIEWVEKARAQTTTDTDTVFGSGVPVCDLTAIFGGTEGNEYLRLRAGGVAADVRRKRGSSGEWSMDPLTRGEVSRYKHAMGQGVKFDAIELKAKPVAKRFF